MRGMGEEPAKSEEPRRRASRVPLPPKTGGGIELASPSCQRPLMSKRTRSTRAAGFILAISILGGAIAGAIVGEPSIGFLAGLAAGVAVATLFWLIERRR